MFGFHFGAENPDLKDGLKVAIFQLAWKASKEKMDLTSGTAMPFEPDIVFPALEVEETIFRRDGAISFLLPRSLHEWAETGCGTTGISGSED